MSGLALSGRDEFGGGYMKDELREAAQISMRHLPLILAIAASFSLIWVGQVPVLLLAPAVIAGFVLTLVLYGRLTESVLGAERSTWWDIFRSNFFNFLIVAILLAIPSWAATRLAVAVDAPVFMRIFSEHGIDALVTAASVYVMPIVFLKGFGVAAIPLGIAFLMTRLRESGYLIGLTLLLTILPATAAFLNLVATQAVYMPGLMLISTWLGAIVFTAATIKLSPRPDRIW